MAFNSPLSLQDLIERINTLINNDSDTPTTTDDEWAVLLNLINQAIGKWETSDVLWDELWASYAHTSPVADNTLTYGLSTLTNMRYPGGFVKLTLDGATSYLQIVSPEEYQKFQEEAKVVYFTGNNSDGWTLNLGWTPSTGDGTVDATISFPYYKYATRFTSNSLTTDKPEMSDANFIVYDVAATKSLLESKNNQFSIYSTDAATAMNNMRVMNDTKPPYQSDPIEDIDFITAGGVVGE